MLKGMERIVEKHIRDKVIRRNPLNQRQHGYQCGKSCDIVLHALVHKIEQGMDEGRYTLGVFIDIEGAFDNANFNSMCSAAECSGVDPMIVRWIHAMLSQRRLRAGVGDNEVRVGVERGCPQGGVLSHLLWCFVVNSLLEEVSQLGIFIQAYADDVCLLISHKNLGKACEQAQLALNRLDAWCSRNGLNANPNKTNFVLFTRNRKIEGLIPILLKGITLQISEEVKYLGITLGKKLTWGKHLEEKSSRALTAFCRRAFGKTWGTDLQRYTGCTQW